MYNKWCALSRLFHTTPRVVFEVFDPKHFIIFFYYFVITKRLNSFFFHKKMSLKMLTYIACVF